MSRGKPHRIQLRGLSHIFVLLRLFFFFSLEQKTWEMIWDDSFQTYVERCTNEQKRAMELFTDTIVDPKGYKV